MEWLFANWEQIISLVSAMAVLAVYLYLRYWNNRRGLEEDLRQLLRDGVEFLKDWAGDQVALITREQVWMIADWLFDRYVSGNPLQGLVDKEGLRALLWGAFCAWRDRFVGAQALMARVQLRN